MREFPFQEIVGLIVFVIVILAQFWTKLRTGKPMPGPDEPEPEFEFPDFGEKRTDTQSPGPARPAGAPSAPRPDDALREALGLPTAPRPAPPPPAAPPPAAPTPSRSAPPVIVRAPTPAPQPQPRPALATARPTQHAPQDAEAANVLAGLERLERETESFRARLEEIGRLEVGSGAAAEARMRQRLAHLAHDMGRAPAQAPPPRPATPISASLANREGLQRAIVLSEILGPPRALNPHV